MKQQQLQQAGFTLIELVTVIVILGIIAAIAIPRFASLSTDARQATANGLLGAMRAAASMVYAQALVKAQTGATGSVTIENTTVSLIYGYPDSTASGIGNSLSNSSGFTYNATTGVFSVNNAPTPATCSITYVSATTSGATPTMTLTTTGC